MGFSGPERELLSYELLGTGDKVFSILVREPHDLPDAITALHSHILRFYPESMPGRSKTIDQCEGNCQAIFGLLDRLFPAKPGFDTFFITDHVLHDTGITLFLGIRPGAQEILVLFGPSFAVSQVHAAILGHAPDRHISLVGVCGENPRFPVPARFCPECEGPISIAPELCTDCKLCIPACPMSLFSFDRGSMQVDPLGCIACMSCVEVCRPSAIDLNFQPDRLYMVPDIAAVSDRMPVLAGRTQSKRPLPKVLIPGPRPQTPLYILGLAENTMQENGAVLLKNGMVVAAVEEERLNRVRHYGFKRPGTQQSLCNDLSLGPEQAFPRKSIDFLLDFAGIGLDAIHTFAINGIPARFRRSFDLEDRSRPPQIMHSGQVMAIPHHLCHAASAFWPSGMSDAMVVTVDGRGDRETAAVYRGHGPDIELEFDVPALMDSSIGGVYETITRILGLGSHGQGSTMALAAFGRPVFDMTDCLSFRTPDDYSIHEHIALKRFQQFMRNPRDRMLQVHKDLAASVQKALEDTVIAIIRFAGGNHVSRLAMAGGVALNCRMNELIRREFRVDEFFIQPAANDAGTALGAALVAHCRLTNERPAWVMQDAWLGPKYSEDLIKQALGRFGLNYQRMQDPGRAIARLLSQGASVAFFDGRMEFGPRALGHRSIIADPGNRAARDRLNRAKGRQAWRPFAPSVIAGREGEVMLDALPGPFMLFAREIRAEAAKKAPAILHVDGSTRPQSVGQDQGVYSRILHEFHALTGLPWVLNTSFNTAHEPIVSSPADAIWSFIHLGLDFLAIGPFLVQQGDHKVLSPPAPPCSQAASNSLSTDDLAHLELNNASLMLRLTNSCGHQCKHCAIRDIAMFRPRSFDEVLSRLKKYRSAGCNQVMFLRGDPLVHPAILKIVHAAKALGFHDIGLQTPGDRLQYKPLISRLVQRGVTRFHVHIFGATANVHDSITGTTGSFDAVLSGIKNAFDLGVELLVEIQVVRDNYLFLKDIVELLHAIGVYRLHISHARPVFAKGRFFLEPVVRLNTAAIAIRNAIDLTMDYGMDISTEGIPLCVLDPGHYAVAEIRGLDRARIVDDFNGIRYLDQVKKESTFLPPICDGCSLKARCPGPWALYYYLSGDEELIPR